MASVVYDQAPKPLASPQVLDKTQPFCLLGRVNTNERICDQRKVDKEGEHHIKLVEAREDPTESLETAEQPLDFIAFFVQATVIVPGLSSVTFRRHHRGHPKISHQLPRFVPFVGTIHDDVLGGQWRLPQQRTALGSITGMAW